eukprot:Partr_v1_DN28522_c0_g1_i3_m73720 putative Ion transport protein
MDQDHAPVYAGGISRTEALSGVANRFLYSNTYKALYLLLAVLSLVCIVIELSQTCPGGFFTFLEVIINISLLLEVAIRIVAQRSMYFKFMANIVDIFLVILCVMTLTLLNSKCSASTRLEEELDALLLVLRNAAQFYRLFILVKRNQTSNQANYLNINGLEEGTGTGHDEFRSADFAFDS